MGSIPITRSIPADGGDVVQMTDGFLLSCTVAYNRHGGYCVPRASLHRPAAQAILAGKIFEPDTIDYLGAHCGEADIVHAGTFFGDFLPALSRQAGPQARIWAFEPNRENYRCARITCEINGTDNIELHHAGLGARSERLFVATRDAQGRSLGGASRIEAQIGGEQGEPVEIVAIDDIVPAQRKVGIIQLDVEGYEQPALSGALGTIRRCRPILILEVLPGSGLLEGDWFREEILALGYRQERQLHQNVVFSCVAAETD